MEKRDEVKSLESYVKELVKVTSSTEVTKYKELLEDGKRIKAIQLLRKYNIIGSNE